MELIYQEKKYQFEYYESEDSWVSQEKIKIAKKQIFFEIPLRNFYVKNIKWDIVTSFLIFLDSKQLDLISILPEWVLVSFSEISKIDFTNTETNDYTIVLEGISYNEPIMPVYDSDTIIFNYSLVYKLYHKNYIECYNPYTDYIVDFKNENIVGLRIQT